MAAPRGFSKTVEQATILGTSISLMQIRDGQLEKVVQFLKPLTAVMPGLVSRALSQMITIFIVLPLPIVITDGLRLVLEHPILAISFILPMGGTTGPFNRKRL